MPNTIEKSPNYRSLVGGFFSSRPDDMTMKRSIRTNNPLALNISAWQKSFPGYVGWTIPDNSPNANKTTIYETPENGFAAWYNLMRIYHAGGYNTVEKVIDHYGGGQDYSGYLAFVKQHTNFTNETPLQLDNDTMLLQLAKAMARHEAGVAIPWSDQQILHGIRLGRQFAKGGAPVVAPVTRPAPVTTVTPSRGFWAVLLDLITKLFSSSSTSTLKATRILKMGDMGDDVRALQRRLRELGFVDIVVDGEIGLVTDAAIRTFQERENLDPDGEVGTLTIDALNAATVSVQKPPLLPPPVAPGGVIQTKPAWYVQAEKDVGFKETGNNRGIEHFIRDAKTGKLGDPWCAIGVNAWLERAGVMGSRSAAARSFETNQNFYRLQEPALGCIVTMWRGSKTAGTGHVFLYDGESSKGIRGIGANEDNMVKRSFHDRDRFTGYWWPKSQAKPSTGPILVSDLTTVVTRSET
jgi:uncharacterized protein (TIGR02594 family)